MEATLWPYGKCKNCANRNYCAWSQSEIVNCMENGYLNYRQMRKADLIRSMSDYELAEFFTPFYYDGPKFYCPAQADVGEGECAAKSDCRQCLLGWLQQEGEC